MVTFERLRKRWWLAAVLAVVAVAGIVVFEPHTLFIDRRVDEAFPAAQAAAPTATVTTAPPTERATTAPPTERASAAPASPDAGTSPGPSPRDPASPTALVTGTFVDRDHPTSGTATVYAVPDAAPLLRFDELATDNGPDLHVYLSSAAAGAPASAFDDDFVYVGPLKGNLGNQNYDLPADVDLDVYRTVVIWCDRFDVAFGAADLA